MDPRPSSPPALASMALSTGLLSGDSDLGLELSPNREDSLKTEYISDSMVSQLSKELFLTFLVRLVLDTALVRDFNFCNEVERKLEFERNRE